MSSAEMASGAAKEGGGPVITVAICTYRRYDLLLLAVHSCLRQTLPDDLYKILIIDNSPEAYRAQAEARYANSRRVEYLALEVPGLANARNVAARRCGTPYIAYLDDDAQASPSWLEAILAGFHLPGADVGVVGGPVAPRWEAPPPAWLHPGLFGFLSLLDWGGQVPRRASAGEWFAGANIAFRTELIARAGYFNTQLGRTGGTTLVSNEETDLVARIEAAGHVRVYAPAAAVSHFVPADRLRQPWFRKRVAWQAVSELLMNPRAATARARNHAWDLLSTYLGSLPPPQRPLAGLFQPAHDPAQFSRQLDALYAHTLLALAGFDPTGASAGDEG
jgi:glycosyltransferase involved in cell wall biosynthesis